MRIGELADNFQVPQIFQQLGTAFLSTTSRQKNLKTNCPLFLKASVKIKGTGVGDEVQTMRQTL